MNTNPGQKKHWLQITLTLDPVLVDAVSDFLVGVTGAGVEVGVEDNLVTKTVNGYLEKENLDEDQVERILTQLQTHLQELAEIFQVETPICSTSFIEEEDWGSNWKKHFKPFAIIPGLVIAPTWEKYQPQEKEKVIVMDPGMAFGTGHHATTKLSLTLMERIVQRRPGVKVLDVGTGTGILGMAAALLGAGSVLGLDNDPDAVEASHENMTINGLQDVMEVSITPLGAINNKYQVVIANIVHDVLINLKEDLSRLTLEDGNLILSGILTGEQTENITVEFGVLGFELMEQIKEQEWSGLLFRKRSGGK